MESGCYVGPRRYLPSNWVIVLTAAVGVHYARERLVNGGLLLEELEAIPDPALQLLERLNLTESLDSLKQTLEEWKDQAISPGQALKDTLTAKHPVVMIPGIISCGLEVWKPGECLGDSFFRERIWGGVTMARAALGNISCWLDHLALDPFTGLDTPGKEVRVAEGLSGADYFVPGYWLWAKFIKSAAEIGYHPGNLVMACYDWRLPYRALERRDRYFTRLRASIEHIVSSTGQKAVIIGHSMGAAVFLFFLQWVARAAGPDWAAVHLHAFVPLGGALLGAVGPLGAMLSGEMQSTAVLGPLNKIINSQMSFLNYTHIRDFLRTIGSMGSLLPKGGDAVWGSAAAPTDLAVDLVSRDGQALSSRDLQAHLQERMGNHTAMAEFFHGLRVPPAWPAAAAPDAAAALLEASDNPLATALPPAPGMRIFCLYGMGIPTERAYRYTLAEDGAGADDGVGMINYSYHTGDDNATEQAAPDAVEYASGVASSDGDGTVPLLSLGYMCSGAWRDEGLRAFNPARVPVHIREYKDQPSYVWEDPRGGPSTAKHVEILGNREVIGDILHILAGKDGHLRTEDRIHSSIVEVAGRVTQNLRAELGPAARGP